jgi:hypothetical protein
LESRKAYLVLADLHAEQAHYDALAMDLQTYLRLAPDDDNREDLQTSSVSRRGWPRRPLLQADGVISATRRRDRTARVSSSVADSVKFRFHPIFFPATQCLSVEKLNVVPVVIRSAVNESGLVDFLPHPSLICLDWQSTVRALSCVVHFYLPHAR